MSTYDEKNKVWSRLVSEPPSETIISPGQKSLDFLSKYGSKVQQVFIALYLTNSVNRNDVLVLYSNF